MTIPLPSLQVLTVQWRLGDCIFSVKHSSVWLLSHASVSSKSNAAWKAFCLGITAALWVTVLLLFGAVVTVGFPEVCGLVWKKKKKAFGDGESGVRCCHWVTRLIFFSPSLPSSWHNSLTVKATVMWQLCQMKYFWMYVFPSLVL